jgi:uncharacterized phiE125 gp8 family phage protein
VSGVIIYTDDSLVTAPTLLPIDVNWAKDHLKALVSSEDLLVESWIGAATQYFERLTGHQIMKATWEHWLDAFPSHARVQLPHPPLRQVLAVEYVSGDGTVLSFGDGASPETVSWQTRAPAGVPARRGWVETKYGMLWPLARIEAGAVRIRYEAGYAEAQDEMPDLIKAALLLLVGHFDQFRSEVHMSEGSSKLERLPFGASSIIREFMNDSLSTQVLRTP